MPKKLSEKVEKKIQKLYSLGISAGNIVRQTGVSYGSVYGLTIVRQKINPETRKKYKSLTECNDYKIRQKINPETRKKYKSLTEYDDHQIKQRINPETGEKYKSRIEYKNYRVRQKINPETRKKYKSVTEYNNYLARQRINPETGEKFKSLTECNNYLARQRTNRKKNRVLSNLIKKGLKELEKNQLWLAEQLGVSTPSISLYAQGKSIPKGEKLEKLLKIINPNSSKKPKNLDDLIGE